MLINVNTCFKKIDYDEKGFVTTANLKEFLEKYCYEVNEFDR